MSIPKQIHWIFFEAFIAETYVQLVATKSNVLLYLLPTSMQLFCLLQESLSE